MNSFDSMRQKLKETALYPLKESGYVVKELQCYADELDAVRERINDIYRDMFIQTAGSDALTAFESLFNIQAIGTDDDRRQRIASVISLKDHDFTKEGMKLALASAGVKNFTYAENFSAQEIIINISDTIPEERQAQLQADIERLFPAHLAVR